MKRKVDLRKRIRRTPFGFYLTAGAVVVGLLAGGIGLGRMTAHAVAVDPEGKPAERVERYESPVETTEAPTYTVEDLELLAMVIYQEAGGDACSDLTRQLVGEVALNRVADSRYPDTLAEVLTQRLQYGRLYWTGLVWPERAELPQEAHAVQRAYDMADALLAGTVDKLLPADAVFQAEFPQGTETLIESDGFYFCR